jgi:hypothetical protein
MADVDRPPLLRSSCIHPNWAEQLIKRTSRARAEEQRVCDREDRRDHATAGALTPVRRAVDVDIANEPCMSCAKS